MEIEIPRQSLRAGLWLLLIVAPLLVGIRASPTTTDGHPLLLTPRLAQLHDYRREATGWVRTLHKVDQALVELVEEPHRELFEQNKRTSRVIRDLQLVAEAIDHNPVPTAFEPLHELLHQTSYSYLEAAVRTVIWVGEPSDETLKEALLARNTATKLLERLSNNPWIETQP
jgi:hypothetical protein